MTTFKKAVKHESKLRLALIGVSGSGKTYTALTLAKHLAGNGKVAVIDTERGSASKYADLFEFDVLELESFSPKNYVEAIKAADNEGYAVIVVDSLSHAWTGKDGALDMVEKARQRSNSNNSFTAWRDVTPQHNALIDAMISAKSHLIATMRAKTEYTTEPDERGKITPRKIGLAPVQRDGMEYEFDVVADMSADNTMVVSKSRCAGLSGAVIQKPGKDVAGVLLEWLSGAPMPVAKPQELFEAQALSGEENSILLDYTALMADADTQESLEQIGAKIGTMDISQALKAELKATYTHAYNRLLKAGKWQSKKA